MWSGDQLHGSIVKVEEREKFFKCVRKASGAFYLPIPFEDGHSFFEISKYTKDFYSNH